MKKFFCLLWTTALLGVCSVGAGCKPSHKGPPGVAIANSPNGNRLTGKVYCNGEPLSGGGIQLFDRSGRLAATGAISHDGSYVLMDILPGPAMVTITADMVMPPSGPGGSMGMPFMSMPRGGPGQGPGASGRPDGKGGPPGLPGGRPGGPGGRRAGPPLVEVPPDIPEGKEPEELKKKREIAQLSAAQRQLLQQIQNKYGAIHLSDLHFILDPGETTRDFQLTIP